MARERPALVVADASQLEAAETLCGAVYQIFLLGTQPDLSNRRVLAWPNGTDITPWVQEVANLPRGENDVVKLLTSSKTPSDFKDWSSFFDWAKRAAKVIEPNLPTQPKSPEVPSLLPVVDVGKPESSGAASVVADESEFSGESSLPAGVSHADSPLSPDDPMPPAFDPDERDYATVERSSVFSVDIRETTWTDPLDFASKLYDGIPLNLAWVPAALQAHVGDYADRMGIDAGIILNGDLAGCSGAADDGYRLAPLKNDPTYTQRPCMWTLTAGDSGTGKTPGMLVGIKPLEEIDKDLLTETLRKRADWDYAMEGYKLIRAESVKNKQPRPEPPEEPADEMIMVNESTKEGIRQGLRFSPRGILAFRDEFSGLIADMDGRYNGVSDRGDFLELWNGGRRAVGRAGQRIVVPNWSATLTGCMTPDGLRAVKLQDDGLLQRFAIVCAKPKKKGVDRSPDMAAIHGYTKILRELRAMRSQEGQFITFSEGAQDVRDRLEEEIELLCAEDDMPRLIRSHLNKFPAFFYRLCLIYHLVGLAADGRHPGLNEKISREVAERVYAYLMIYQYSHIEEFWYAVMGNSSGASFASRIASYILAHGITELSHNSHIVRPHFLAWSGMLPVERREAVNKLIAGGWIRAKSHKVNHEKFPMTYEVNSAVHEKFTVRAQSEKERRNKVTASINAARAAARD